MSAKKSNAYAVYLLFQFCLYLAFSMATVLSVVYHLEVVHLDPFQLVLVGTALETACFLFEIPTGVVADLYSRRRSMLIGIFLFGIGFLIEGALPWFATVLLAQVVWGCGYTFITGALEAWIATEETGRPMFKLNLSFVKGAPVLLTLLAITLCGGLASEGFDRLSTAHFLDNTIMPDIGPLNNVTWFGVISLVGSGLGILTSQLLINRMEKKGTIRRTGLVMFASAGYILCLFLFAASRNFCFMLTVFLLSGLMRTVKEPILTAWMNDHVEERMRATVFSTNGQLDSFGQIIGGPIVGLIAQQVSVSWGMACTAFLLLPALFLVPLATKAGRND